MTIRLICTVTMVAGLGACSSGGTSTPSDEIAGPFTSIVAASYAAGAPAGPSNRAGPLPNTVTLTGSSGALTLQRDPSLDQNGFATYRNSTAGVIDNIAMLDRTEYSDVALSYLRPTTQFPNAGVVYGSTTANNGLAASGSAIYRGDYAGIIVNEPNGFILQRSAGTARISANFNSDTVSGRITDRSFASINSTATFGTDHTDIVFDDATIDSFGHITGTTTGGHLDAAGWTPATGTVDANVSGPQSNDIVGRVLIDHTIGGVPYTEIGGFLTTR